MNQQTNSPYFQSMKDLEDFETVIKKLPEVIQQHFERNDELVEIELEIESLNEELYDHPSSNKYVEDHLIHDVQAFIRRQRQWMKKKDRLHELRCRRKDLLSARLSNENWITGFIPRNHWFKCGKHAVAWEGETRNVYITDWADDLPALNGGDSDEE